MAQIAAVTPDLLFGSKISATLLAAGHEVSVTPELSVAPLADATLIVADLEAVDPEAAAGVGIPVLGYYSHVNVETRDAAKAAGIDLAVPRSRLSRELPELVANLLGDST